MKKIQKDDVIIYPTDTVWGIGCSIYSEKGYLEIAKIKKTSTSKPLSIMFGSISEIESSFDFPDEITNEWLKQFFKLETTLGLPISLCRFDIPKWAIGDSQFITIRYIENEVIHEISRQLGTPFFTTSLNISGQMPITHSQEAIEFKNFYASQSLFFDLPNAQALSGVSSTIVFINENLSFEIKRKGRNSIQIEELISKLFTNQIE